MATTTNYSWSTPDDTALVKDGAAAIRTLGSSIDTTTKALNPSTTLGDIEYRSSTANTNTRLGIGSTGDILTVTGGVPVWAPPVGVTASFIGAKATSNAATTCVSGTWTAIAFQTEDFDTDSFHSTVTNNSRITIPSGKNGKYLFIGAGGITNSGSGTGRRFLSLYKNGSQIASTQMEFTASSTAVMQLQTTAILDLVATDYIQLFLLHTVGSDRDTDFGLTTLTCQFLGA
jgi:hypothetical protein